MIVMELLTAGILTVEYPVKISILMVMAQVILVLLWVQAERFFVTTVQTGWQILALSLQIYLV